MISESLFNEQLQCFVLGMSYDFSLHYGMLDLPERNCTDMCGCIAFFKRLDAGVVCIEVFQNGKQDIIYWRKGREWASVGRVT